MKYISPTGLQRVIEKTKENIGIDTPAPKNNKPHVLINGAWEEFNTVLEHSSEIFVTKIPTSSELVLPPGVYEFILVGGGGGGYRSGSNYRSGGSGAVMRYMVTLDSQQRLFAVVGSGGTSNNAAPGISPGGETIVNFINGFGLSAGGGNSGNSTNSGHGGSYRGVGLVANAVYADTPDSVMASRGTNVNPNTSKSFHAFVEGYGNGGYVTDTSIIVNGQPGVVAIVRLSQSVIEVDYQNYVDNGPWEELITKDRTMILPAGTYEVECCGGGGSGGTGRMLKNNSSWGGTGGNAGQVVKQTIVLNAPTEIKVAVGTGGEANTYNSTISRSNIQYVPWSGSFWNNTPYGNIPFDQIMWNCQWYEENGVYIPIYSYTMDYVIANWPNARFHSAKYSNHYQIQYSFTGVAGNPGTLSSFGSYITANGGAAGVAGTASSGGAPNGVATPGQTAQNRTAPGVGNRGDGGNGGEGSPNVTMPLETAGNRHFNRNILNNSNNITSQDRRYWPTCELAGGWDEQSNSEIYYTIISYENPSTDSMSWSLGGSSITYEYVSSLMDNTTVDCIPEQDYYNFTAIRSGSGAGQPGYVYVKRIIV